MSSRRERIEELADQGLGCGGIRRVVRILEALDAEHEENMLQAMQHYAREHDRMLEDYFRLRLDLAAQHSNAIENVYLLAFLNEGRA